MTPLTRTEHFINCIISGTVPDLTAHTQVENYLARIAGASYPVLTPLPRVEKFLAAIVGDSNTVPAPLTRVEMYLAAIAGADIVPPPPKTRIEHWLDDWLHAAPPTEIITVTGTSPLTLARAVAGKLLSLVQRGKCTVESGAIKCNNGMISSHDDELPDGYRRILSMSMNNNCYYTVPDFHLTGADTLRFSFMMETPCNVIGSYSGSTSGANYSLYVSSENYKYLRYYSGTYSSKALKGKRYDVEITPTGTTGMEIDSTWEEIDFVCPNDFFIGATTTTGTSAIFRGTFDGNVEVEGPNGLRFKGIPCERVSDDEIGWYDTVSETFFEPVGTTPTAGGYDYSHIVRTVTGTPEVITATSGDTAEAVNLLAVGSVADMQDIISGEVTRRTEAILFDGTQDVGRPYLSSTGALDVGAIVVHAPGTEHSGAVVTFDAEEATPINAAIVSLEPMQDLHGYDKPWDGGAGKNLVDVADVTGVTSQTQIGTVTLPAGDYTMSAYISNSGSAGAGVRITKSDNTTIKSIGFSKSTTASRYSGSFTLEEETNCKIFVVGTASGYNASASDVQVEAGTTLTDYAPYRNECPITGHTSVALLHNGDEITVAIPATPGIVYGCEMDVVNGTLMVDRAMFAGTDWRAFSKGANGFYGRIYLNGAYLRRSSTDIYKCRGNLIPVSSGNAYDWHANVAGTIGSATQYLHMYVPFGALPEYRDGDNVTTLFSARYDATAFRFVLPIEPVVYQLTPQQIDTLVGENVFSSDAGAVSVWVQADPTTETVTAQEINLVDGDNTLTVTAAVSGSELKAVYTALTE